MNFPISAAKVRKKNDTRKSVCHFFAFYAILVTFLIKNIPLDKLR